MINRNASKKTTSAIFPAMLGLILLSSHSSFAEPTIGKCGGILRQSGGSLVFGGGEGEDESICVVDKAEVSKVRASCHIGAKCVVEGTVDYCKDSGECVQIR